MTENRRQYARIAMDRRGLLIWGVESYSCRLLDMSAGGAAITTEARPDGRCPVALHADDLGRFRGSVVRHLPRGLAICFFDGEKARLRTLDKLADHRHWAQVRSGAATVSARQRLFLECLAVSGRVAAALTGGRGLCWQVVADCEARGWVEVTRVDAEFAAVEITAAGRRQARTCLGESAAPLSEPA